MKLYLCIQEAKLRYRDVHSTLIQVIAATSGAEALRIFDCICSKDPEFKKPIAHEVVAGRIFTV